MPCSSKYIGGKRSNLKRSTQKRTKKQQGGFGEMLSTLFGFNNKPANNQNLNQHQQMTAGQQLNQNQNQNQQLLQQLQQISGGKSKGKGTRKSKK